MKQRAVGGPDLRIAAGVAGAISLFSTLLIAQTLPVPQTATPESPKATATATAAAPAACIDCHDSEVKNFARNPHTVAHGRVGDAICISCHGDSSAHIDSSGDKPVEHPMTGLAAVAVCQTCHSNVSDRRSFQMGVHARVANVSCTSCHSIHQAVASQPHLLAREPVALCATCHASEAASFASKPFVHRLGRSGMTCLSCHDPHGTAIRPGLALTRAGEQPCLDCHSEKRGPFVFTHGSGSITECQSCHEPHGSVNPHQLKRARVSQLCLECHSPISPGTLGAGPPSFHNLTLPRFQNCTVCHTAVHGSQISPILLK